MFLNCLVREMQFKINFMIRLLAESLWLFLMVAYFLIIYKHVHDIDGWTKWDMILLLGTNHFINQIFEGIFFENCIKLTDNIRQGDLDFALTKPMNSQFLVSVRYTDFASIMNAVVGLIMVVVALHKMHYVPTWSQDVMYAILILNGILIYYTFMFSFSILTFWMGRANNLFDLYYQFSTFSRYPANIYKGALRFILWYLIPMLVVANCPVDVFKRTLSGVGMIYGFIVGFLFFIMSTFFWKKGLAHYRSASS
jgi:ABC-2 type transport system permease protein